MRDRLTAHDGSFHVFDKVMRSVRPEMFPVREASNGYFRSLV